MDKDVALGLKMFAVVAALSLSPADNANSGALKEQWKYSPDNSMHNLVSKGYEIKAYSYDHHLSEFTKDVYIYKETYLLQKGDSVYRCIEDNEYDKTGYHVTEGLNCFELVKPQ